MKIQTKRIYEEAAESDGRRILIDRLWPRGISKEAAKIDFWVQSIAPSNELRRWYQHDPEKWPEFRRRYFEELEGNPAGLEELRAQLGDAAVVTFVFSSKEEKLNNASALREYLSTGSR